MVVVRIELWPGGDESKARSLGTATITNNASGNDVNGNYDVALSHSGIYIDRPGVWRTGKVIGHCRDLSPYHLVAKALANAAGMGPKQQREMFSGS